MSNVQLGRAKTAKRGSSVNAPSVSMTFLSADENDNTKYSNRVTT